MISEIPHKDVVLPYANDDRLCLGRGLLNPDCFLDKFKKYPWFPFEDFSFNEDEVTCLLDLFGSKANVWREDLPCRPVQTKVYSITRPDKMDGTTVARWLAYDEGVLWSESGMLVINSYSDFVILSLRDDVAITLFGETVAGLYEASTSVFIEDSRHDTSLSRFMAGVRKTWGGERLSNR